MVEKKLSEQFLIFKCLAGSHAYGTNTPSSDVDTRGIFIAPPDYVLGAFKSIEQVQSKEPDEVIYEIGKFIQLAVDCNPNIIELLFTDDDAVLFTSPAYERLRENAHLFLSTKAKHTFSGYAMAQMKRIKGHHKWILNPQPEKAPTLAQFCTRINANGHMWKPEEHDMRIMDTAYFLVKTFGENCFRVYEAEGEYRGVISDDGTNFKYYNIHPDDLARFRYHGMLICDLVKFKEARTNWEDYWEWKRNRNEDRAALEEKYGFDCYSDDTEFLTRTGWKRFDEIGPVEEVATMHPLTMKIEFQYPYCRHDAIYSGRMYNFTGHHTDINVSGNHRMFVRQYNKNSGTFGQWEFRQACLLPGSFQIVSRIKPCQQKFSNPQPCGADLRFYLKLMGWYVAEGHVCKRLKDGTASVLSVSQIEGGNLHWKISRSLGDYEGEIKRLGMRVSHCRYDLKPTETKENRAELRWTFAHREIAQKISSECGTGSENKKLPRWVFDLSQRMMEILLDAILGGDGTDCRPHDAQIYYTSSPQLADDVNELAFLCGFETSKWGPYDGMYHVHINKTGDEVRTLHNSDIKMTNVTGQRIVCFSVPNEILVTRRNGRIAMQGNTKHASHLVRLMRMAEEILTEGKVLVRRPDAKELLEIRNGKINYDQLIEWAAAQDQKLNALYETSPLPKFPDREAVNNLLVSIRKDFWKDHGLL